MDEYNWGERTYMEREMWKRDGKTLDNLVLMFLNLPNVSIMVRFSDERQETACLVVYEHSRVKKTKQHVYDS